MGRDAKSMELAKAKADYALEVTKADAELSMTAVGKKVIEKFGKSLAPNKLRAAFLEGGGTIQPRGKKRRAGNPGARVGALPKRASAGLKTKRKKASKQTGKSAARKSHRAAGRRKADKAAARTTRALNEAHKHMVVIQAGDLQLQGFNSAEQAKQFISAELANGTPVAGISFYTRQPIEVSVGI